MLFCNAPVRQHIDCPAPFNVSTRQIMFVHSYCYLGCVINYELCISNENKAVYREAERKVYMLGKLRYFIDKDTALLIYKQAVLPYFDYGGFLLVSCNQGQRKDLRPGSTMRGNERKKATDVKAFVGNRGLPTNGNRRCCGGR